MRCRTYSARSRGLTNLVFKGRKYRLQCICNFFRVINKASYVILYILYYIVDIEVVFLLQLYEDVRDNKPANNRLISPASSGQNLMRLQTFAVKHNGSNLTSKIITVVGTSAGYDFSFLNSTQFLQRRI